MNPLEHLKTTYGVDSKYYKDALIREIEMLPFDDIITFLQAPKEQEIVRIEAGIGIFIATREGREFVPTPSVSKKVLNFAGAIIDAAKDGFEIASKEEQEQRLAICRACPIFKVLSETCGDCGCNMNGKVTMKTWNCPRGKW